LSSAAVFPHNWQIVIATLGTYGLLGFIATSGKKPQPAAPTKPDLHTGENAASTTIALPVRMHG
jgi:hypothetical protein